MQRNIPVSFEASTLGIHFWYLDQDGIANFVGPLTFLEPRQHGQYLFHTRKGPGWVISVSLDQVSEFRRLGGTVATPETNGTAALNPPAWGFRKLGVSLVFWYRGSDGIRYIGPILLVEHLEGERYCLVTSEGRHPIRLTALNLSEFRGLGGALVGKQDRGAGVEIAGSFPVATPVQPVVAQPPAGRGLPSEQPFGLRWVGDGEKVQIGPYTIRNPLVYVCNGAAGQDEASCLNLELPVGTPTLDPTGALGYWPQYRTISPNQRANYLAWLAGDRNGGFDDIGYGFLYFYGLERRFLLDKQDINPITCEIVRLLNRYTFSGSFTGYLSRFLVYVIARTGLEKLREDWFNRIFTQSPIQPNEEILALALAWHVKRRKPLSAEWAMRMARQHPQAPRSVVFERVPDHLQALFAKKYEDRYGQGLELKTAKRERTISYTQPASPSLLAMRQGRVLFAESEPIPNVLGLQSQFLALVKILAECIGELTPLSGRVRKGVEVNTRAAYEVLPEDLKAETIHPDKAQWDEVLAKNATEDGIVLVPISELAAIQGIPRRARLTAKQSESLAQTAKWIGYCIEPDSRITRRHYNWDELVALFQPEGEAWLPADDRYTGSALILELGLAVAWADGAVTDEERE